MRVVLRLGPSILAACCLIQPMAAAQQAGPMAVEAPTDAPRSDVHVEPGGPGEATLRVEKEPTAPSENALEVLGEFVEPGSVARLYLRNSESFASALLETPIVVAHGRQEGPTLCIVAGVHGDEVNGVEVVRQVLQTLDVDSLAGAILAVPIANPSAFLRGSRYLLDRRDLNRYFPGTPHGSSASRIAHRLFEGVLRQCDALIDLHTGSFKRTNFHQVRANLAHEETASLAAAFGANVVINSEGREGTLRRASTDIGMPAITVEAGAPGLFDENHVLEALDGIHHLLSARGMSLSPAMRAPRPETVAYLRTRWIRCDRGGILVSKVELGDEVAAGQVLGTISDPLSEEVTTVVSPIDGRIIGMALDQIVLPGFAGYHVGFEPRPLGAKIPAVSDDAEEALEWSPEGVDLEERPE